MYISRIRTTVSSKYGVWALAAICVLGGAIRSYQIGYNFDGDEIFSVLLAGQSFDQVVRLALIDTVHPPLHLLLLHAWMAAFGPSEVAVRALSILLSLAFLATAYAVLLRFLCPAMAMKILCLLAVSPLFVYYGQQARPYALITFLSAANLLAFLSFGDAPQDHRRGAAWCAVNVFLLYAQYLGALLILAEVAFGLATWSRYRPRLVFYAGLGGITIIPWILAAMGGAIVEGSDPLKVFSWMSPPTALDFPWFYVTIFGELANVRAVLLLLFLVIIGGFWATQQLRSRTLPDKYLLLSAIAVGIPALVWSLSVWGPKPAFAPRQLLVAAIAFLVLIGLWLESLPRRVAAVCWCMLLAWMVAALPQAFPVNAKPPWTEIARRVSVERAAMPVVTFESWVRDPVAFYSDGEVISRAEDVGTDSTTVLVLCRPPSCGGNAGGLPVDPAFPMVTWTWGGRGKSGHGNMVMMYRAGRRSTR